MKLMFNKMVRISLITATLVILMQIPTLADSGTPAAQPGSVEDPVITKSYFDQNIQSKIAAEVAKQLGGNTPVPNTGGGANNGTSTPNPNTAGVNLQIVKLEQGQSLYGGQGTELIVRTGKVVVFSSDESGIADVTKGKDITAGQAVELNHLLIVPREGRGVKADAKNKEDIYVMVRGAYTVK